MKSSIFNRGLVVLALIAAAALFFGKTKQEPVSPMIEAQSVRAPEIFEILERRVTYPHPSKSVDLAILRGSYRLEAIPAERIAQIPADIRFVQIRWKYGTDEIESVIPLFPTK